MYINKELLKSKLRQHSKVLHHDIKENRAAVAVVFNVTTQELLFIKRATHPHDHWSGHVAFPGGRKEPGDSSDLITAQRETLEEIGVNLFKDAEHVGFLNEIQGRADGQLQNFIIAPVVFIVDKPLSFKLDTNEVDRCFWVSFSQLTDEKNAGMKTFRFSSLCKDLPVIYFESETIWGLTLMILFDLFEKVAEIKMRSF